MRLIILQSASPALRDPIGVLVTSEKQSSWLLGFESWKRNDTLFSVEKTFRGLAGRLVKRSARSSDTRLKLTPPHCTTVKADAAAAAKVQLSSCTDEETDLEIKRTPQHKLINAETDASTSRVVGMLNAKPACRMSDGYQGGQLKTVVERKTAQD